jgi:hypothetical protein
MHGARFIKVGFLVLRGRSAADMCVCVCVCGAEREPSGRKGSHICLSVTLREQTKFSSVTRLPSVYQTKPIFSRPDSTTLTAVKLPITRIICCSIQNANVSLLLLLLAAATTTTASCSSSCCCCYVRICSYMVLTCQHSIHFLRVAA